jgi:hypothetical protein
MAGAFYNEGYCIVWIFSGSIFLGIADLPILNPLQYPSLFLRLRMRLNRCFLEGAQIP